MVKKSGLDFPLNKGFVSQFWEGISDNLNHKKSAQMPSQRKHDEYYDYLKLSSESASRKGEIVMMLLVPHHKKFAQMSSQYSSLCRT